MTHTHIHTLCYCLVVWCCPLIGLPSSLNPFEPDGIRCHKHFLHQAAVECGCQCTCVSGQRPRSWALFPAGGWSALFAPEPPAPTHQHTGWDPEWMSVGSCVSGYLNGSILCDAVWGSICDWPPWNVCCWCWWGLNCELFLILLLCQTKQIGQLFYMIGREGMSTV